MGFEADYDKEGSANVGWIPLGSSRLIIADELSVLIDSFLFAD